MTLASSGIPFLCFFLVPVAPTVPTLLRQACCITAWGLLRVWPLATTRVCEVPTFPRLFSMAEEILFGGGQGASSPRPQRTKNKTWGYLEMAQEISVAGAIPQLMLCGKETSLGGRRYGLDYTPHSSRLNSFSGSFLLSTLRVQSPGLLFICAPLT
jgi:hypothetical protein